MDFHYEFEVTFGDSDPAGIAYYPRILDFCHRAFEAFFAASAAESYAFAFMKNNLGFPTVAIDAQFKAPMRYGDRIRLKMNVGALSAKSVTFVYEFRRIDGTLCAVIRNTTVAIDRLTFKSVPIPERYRSAFERYLVESNN
jgi:4-hydroxybenzoyl-CoA thioesterase